MIIGRGKPVVVGTAARVVAHDDKKRVLVWFQNLDSSADVYISCNPDVTSSMGYVLKAGKVFGYAGEAAQTKFFGISGGSVSVHVEEFFRVRG